MHKDEVKMKIRCFVDQTIDSVVPMDNIFNKLKNSTFKLVIDENINKLDPILSTFADEQGEIDIEHIISHYQATLFTNGELRVDLKSIIPDEYSVIKDMVPNKVILFRQNDLANIFK